MKITLFNTLTGKILAGTSIALLLLTGTGYAYFKWSQKQIGDLKAELQTTRQEMEVQNKALEFVRKQSADIKNSRDKLYAEHEEATKELDVLRDKFTKNGRDFGRIAKKKPELVENIVNKATANALRCMELITGATPTEAEKNEFVETGFYNACRY